jgi:hypothetical protein
MDILIVVASVGALIAFEYGRKANDPALKADAHGTAAGLIAIAAVLAVLNLFLCNA